MKTFFRSVLIGAVAMSATAGTVMAWAQANEHSNSAAPSQQGAASVNNVADGEVRRVDLENGKVTLKHGPIQSLDMPPMTMVFYADKSLLVPLKVGDKVTFRAVHEAGKYVVTNIQTENK